MLVIDSLHAGAQAVLINRSGYIDFDIESSFRPVTYAFKFVSSVEEGVTRGTLEYEDAGAVPILKRTTEESEIRAGKKGLLFGKETRTFSDVQYNEQVSDEEFRLSFYGLPEPEGVAWPKPTPWYLWFLGFAAVSLALAGLFRYHIKRRKLPLAQRGATEPPGL